MTHKEEIKVKKTYKKIVCIIAALTFSASTVTVAVPQNTINVTAKTIHVYVAASGNGKCYHSSKTCSRMRGNVKKMKLKQAKKAGYRACKKCYR